jgi:hypothetical protein
LRILDFPIFLDLAGRELWTGGGPSLQIFWEISKKGPAGMAIAKPAGTMQVIQASFLEFFLCCDNKKGDNTGGRSAV